MKETQKQMNIENLPNEQKGIAECIGVEAYFKLSQRYGGNLLYIAKMNSLKAKERNEQIKRDFYNGATYKQLAVKYCLSEIWIKNIVAGKV